MTQLTEHFSLSEFTRSDTAESLGIDNSPTPEHLAHLQSLAEALERVRALLGHPLHITSGYRSPALNAAVGGVATSAHSMGMAADFVVSSMDTKDAGQIIAASDIDFDQLIRESSRGILHLSVDPRMRRQVLTQAGPAGTPVTNGI